MRIAISILCVLPLVNVAVAQELAEAPNPPVQVHILTILGDDLPEADRLRIAQVIEGKSCGVKGIQERVTQGLRDIGYEDARVETPKLTATLEGRSVDVSIRVAAGAQYRLEEIRFRGASVFSADQLRILFPIATGDLFSAAAIGRGLERVRELYGTKGYVECVVIPALEVDSVRRTIGLTLNVDEGERSGSGRTARLPQIE